MAISILMPAFNEADSVGEVVSAIPDSICGRPVTVLVVDDGSVDATASVAHAAGAGVVSYPVNRGKGAAICEGLEHVRDLDFEAVVWMDADGQHCPTALEALTCPVLSGEADMVVGSRYLAYSQPKAPLNRRMVRKLAIEAIEAISGFTLTDPFSGYRAFSPAGIEALSLAGERYECELEAFFSIANAGLTIKEVPVPRIYGPGMSRMGYHHGKLLGRLLVVYGYAATLVRAQARTRVAPGPRASV